MKILLLLLTAAILIPACAFSAQSVAGDWIGTLSAGGAQLRLVLHITEASDGTLTGTMDSIDQGANGIPLSAIKLTGSKIKFAVPSVHGEYEGTLTADTSSMSGNWTQGQPFPLDFKRGTTTKPKAANPSDIDGTWAGSLDTGSGKLRLIFHITNTTEGLTATADSPDQGATGMPVSSVTRTGSSLKLEMKQIGGSFEGTIDPKLDSISGTWSQGGGSAPLVLNRTKAKAQLEPRRPQNPAKPYPYKEDEVSYKNPVAGITLAGTFTIPRGKGPFPAVVLITGSGPQDRDESLLGHKPFLVLSDYLTRQGIAVLRADDRGVGKSGGVFAGATTADFATDAEAGLAYLKTRPEADPCKLGLVVHSEGGIIAPMVAARNPDVAFIVMLAGTGVPGADVLREQRRLIFHSTEEPTIQPDSAWYRYFISYDPASALRKVTCPVLALNGSRDLQVPPEQNIPAIKKALTAAGNKHFEVDELPGLNHLFQTAQTGSPFEYASIEETIAPVALRKIATWINSTVALLSCRS